MWLGVQSNLVVISQKLVEEINGFVGDETLVFRGDEAVPWLLLESSQNVVVLGIQFDFVLVEVVEEIVGS